MSASSPILTGLDPILDRIAAAARAAGRDPADVTLVAVSKQQPWERIEPVLPKVDLRGGSLRVLLPGEPGYDDA